MGIYTTADKLTVGDLFTTPDYHSDHVRRVTGVRTLKTVEAYTLIEYLTVGPNLRGQLDLRHDIPVMILEPVDDIDHILEVAFDGDRLSLWVVEGALYA